MIATSIAYGVTAFFAFLVFVSVVMVFRGEVKKGSEIYHIGLIFVFSAIAWGFARLGGI